MNNTLHIVKQRYRPGRRLIVLAAMLASACSGSSSAPDTMPVDQSVDRIPTVLLQLQDDPGLLATVPDVVESTTLANTGLQVAYTRAGQDLDVPALTVEAQWQHMQTCLELVAVAPVVVVRDDAVIPFTLSDDVIHNIEGIPVASSSRGAVPLIQIQAADFDSAADNPGFNLRSIMGRLLWISAGLAERNYPFQCAREQVNTL